MQRFYPAVLERGAKQTFGVWFPDFPRSVAAGTSQEQAMARAQEALARAVESLAEQDGRFRSRPHSKRSPFRRIAILSRSSLWESSRRIRPIG